MHSIDLRFINIATIHLSFLFLPYFYVIECVNLFRNDRGMERFYNLLDEC